MSKKRLKNARRNDSKSRVIDINDYTPTRHRKKKVEIIPRNIKQEEYLFAMDESIITFGVGPAGTGKSFLATLTAIQELKSGQVERIIVTRPAVSVDEQHGFLPGDLVAKMAPWTRPIFDIFEEYYTPKQITSMIEDGVIEICPLAFMRGRTFKNAFVIADEIQNCTPNQVKMLLTRIGDDTKMVVTGDLDQHDRGFEENGLRDFLKRVNPSKNISVVQFEHTDIERSAIVIEVLKSYN